MSSKFILIVKFMRKNNFKIQMLAGKQIENSCQCQFWNKSDFSDAIIFQAEISQNNQLKFKEPPILIRRRTVDEGAPKKYSKFQNGQFLCQTNHIPRTKTSCINGQNGHDDSINPTVFSTKYLSSTNSITN